MKPEPLPAQDTDLASSLVGVWGLTRREDYDDRGNRLIDRHLGADPLGMLCFSNDYFSAQFSKRDRSEPSDAVAVQTANNSSAVGGYDAYFSRYWSMRPVKPSWFTSKARSRPPTQVKSSHG